MTKHNNRHRQPKTGVENQGVEWPWKLIWTCILAPLWVSPIWLIWLGIGHWRVLLGPKNYPEAYFVMRFVIALLGSGLLALVFEYRARDKSHARGLDKQERRKWARVAASWRNIRSILLFLAFAIGIALLLTLKPHRYPTWDELLHGAEFEPMLWYIGIFFGVLGAAGIQFEKSKNPIAKFLFGTPVPKFDRFIERMFWLRGGRP